MHRLCSWFLFWVFSLLRICCIGACSQPTVFLVLRVCKSAAWTLLIVNNQAVCGKQSTPLPGVHLCSNLLMELGGSFSHFQSWQCEWAASDPRCHECSTGACFPFRRFVIPGRESKALQRTDRWTLRCVSLCICHLCFWGCWVWYLNWVQAPAVPFPVSPVINLSGPVALHVFL